VARFVPVTTALQADDYLQARRQGGGDVEIAYADLYAQVDVHCLSTARPTGVAGLRIFETDTLRTLLHDGTNWIVMQEPITSEAMTGFAATGGTFTAISGTIRHRRSGAQCWWSATITITTVGTATGYVSFTLPRAGIASSFIGAGREVAAVGYMMQVITTGTSTAQVQRYDNATSIGGGWTMYLSGSYEMATPYT